MADVARFKTADGRELLVEVDEQAFGTEPVSRDEKGIIEAAQRLDEALDQSSAAIEAVIDTLRKFAPEEHTIEFAIKFSAEAGVVIAKTAVEGNVTVRLTWKRPART